MARLHLKFKNVHPRTVEVIRGIIEAKPWDMHTVRDASDYAREVLAQLCIIYGISPRLDFEDGPHLRLGEVAVLGEGDSISLNVSKWSTIALLAGFRTTLGDDEQRAHAWACSAFYKASPVSFRNLARKGMVVGVTARDTYTSESWDRLLGAGYATYDGDLLVHPRDAATFLTIGTAADYEDANTDEGDALVSDVAEVEADEAPPSMFTAGDDGLENLNITQLRRLSRGHVSGGYNMRREVLIAALRQAGVRP